MNAKSTRTTQKMTRHKFAAFVLALASLGPLVSPVINISASPGVASADQGGGTPQGSRRVTVTDIGPEGGASFAVAGFLFNRADPRQILLPASERIFRSFDGGAHWLPAHLLSPTGIADGSYYVRQDPNDSRILFATKSFGSNVPQGLYRSADFGATWTRSDAWFFDPIDVAVHEASSNVVLVLTANADESALWRSEDGGVTFEPQPDTGLPRYLYDEETFEDIAYPYYTNIATTPADPNVVYVVQHSDDLGYYPPSIYKSVDGGLTFARLADGPPRPLQVFPHPTRANVVFVQDSSATPSIYRSLDGGATFERVTEGLPPDRLNFFVAFDLNNPEFVYIAGRGGFFRSTDGGLTFELLGLTSEQLGRGATTAAIDPGNSSIVYVNTTQGNFKSHNGGATFTAINNGWRASVAYDVTFDHAREPALYVTTATHGIMKSVTRGRRYERLANPIDAEGNVAWPIFLATAPSNPDMIVAGTSRKGPFVSNDRGRSWTPATVNGTLFNGIPEEIAIDPIDSSNVYFVAGAGNFATNRGFFRSTDGGRTFQRTATDPWGFQALAVAPSRPSVMFTGRGVGPRTSGPLKSSDAGLTFSDGPLPYAYVRDAAIDPRDADTVYLAGRFMLPDGSWDTRQVVRSTDGGATYVAADQGLTGAIIALAVDLDDSSRLYAWTRGGLFLSRDRAATWTLLEADQSVREAGYGSSVVINPKKPNLLYLVGSTVLEVEIQE